MKDRETNLTKADHDVLIRVDTKLDNLTSRLASFETGMNQRVAKTEIRLDQVDIYHATYPLSDWAVVIIWVKKLQDNISFIATIGGVTVALLGGTMALFLAHVFHW